MAVKQGIDPSGPRFPVQQLERWPEPEVILGIAKHAEVQIVGSAVMRVEFPPVGQPDTPGPVVLLRAKIFALGTSAWHGIIIGAPALESTASGGLGYQPLEEAHLFETLGVACERTEQRDHHFPLPGVYPVHESNAHAPAAVWPATALPSFEHPPNPADETSRDHNHAIAQAARPEAQYSTSHICPCSICSSPTPYRCVKQRVPLCRRCTVSHAAAVPQPRSSPVPPPTSPARSSWLVRSSPLDDMAHVLVAVMAVLLLDLPHAVDLSPGDGAWVPARLQRREQSVAPPQVYWAVQPLADSAWEPMPGLWDNDKQNSVFVCNVTDTEVSLPPQSAIAGLLPVHVASGHCPSCGHTVTDCYIQDESHGLFPLQEYTCCDLQANASLHAWPSANSVGSGDMVGHVVEDTALLELMVETEIPPDEYYQALRQDMCSRHPEVSPHVLDHLVSLEGLLGVAIISGFSFGAEKARICVVEGPLLGDIISRTGRKPMGDRVQAVHDFAPLRDKQHIQQFLGCTNWLRWSLPVQYPLVAKSLGSYLKPGAVFPAAGLGPGDTEGDNAVRCIKAMAQQAIEAGCLDEAAAIDNSRPLEQVADASGIGWGGTVLQMNEDMTTFKVLLTAGKGFTPTQQAWPPLVVRSIRSARNQARATPLAWPDALHLLDGSRQRYARAII